MPLQLRGVKFRQSIALLSAKISIKILAIGSYFIKIKKTVIICLISLFLNSPLLVWFYLAKTPPPFTGWYYALIFISSVIFFYFLFTTLIKIDNSNELFIKKRSIAVLLFALVLIMTSNYVNILSPQVLMIGVPFGHFGDFFQLLHLVNIHSYSEITQIGYLPTIILFGKAVLFFFNKTAELVPINTYNISVYSLLSLGILFVTTLHAWKIDRRYFFLPLFIVFLVSYPSILQFERGNWVLASLLFLSLFLFYYDNQRLAPTFLSAFVLLKILNFFILPSILFIKKFNYLFFLISSIIIFVVSLFYMYFVSPGDADYHQLLTSVFGSSMHFPDAHIATAHSGAYATYRFLFTSGIFQSISPEIFTKFSLLILVLLSLMFLLLFIIIYKVKKVAYDVKEFCFCFLTFFCVTKFFHPNMTDMNLILLFPVIIRLTSLRMNFIENIIYACVVILVLPLHLFPLSFVHYTDAAARTFDYWFSVKSYIYSVSLFVAISFIAVRSILFLRITSPWKSLGKAGNHG
jgi:hypothetical protein